MAEHHPDHVALVAAMLLQGAGTTPSPHHVKAAVATARLILDEASGPEAAEEASPAEAPELETEQPDGKEPGGRKSKAE